MKQAVLFVSMLLIMFIPVFGMAEDVSSDQAAGETVEVAPPAVTSEVIVLEDGTEEVIISIPAAEAVHAFVDDRVVAIQSEAQEKIQGVVEDINQLADKSDEGELQKKIERIKLDAEIARFKIYLQDAEDAQDSDRTFEISNEIDQLENLDKPAIGVPEEQPAPKAKGDKMKGGKGNG